MGWIPFLKMSMTFIKVVKNQIFKKVYLPLKPTWRSCFFLFHSHDPKPKQNHQISISRAKIRSTGSQTCVKYRGNIIFIKGIPKLKIIFWPWTNIFILWLMAFTIFVLLQSRWHLRATIQMTLTCYYPDDGGVAHYGRDYHEAVGRSQKAPTREEGSCALHFYT